MLADMEAGLEAHLLNVKQELIRALAEEHGFDVEEALDLFAKPDPAVEKKAKQTTKKAKKAKKAKKDPNAPKKPTTAYFFFMKDKRSEVSAEFPDLKTTEITAKLGSMWHDVKEAGEDNTYNELNAKDKERYTAEMANYSSPPSSPTSSED